jgi:hypothetical protein
MPMLDAIRMVTRSSALAELQGYLSLQTSGLEFNLHSSITRVGCGSRDPSMFDTARNDRAYDEEDYLGTNHERQLRTMSD